MTEQPATVEDVLHCTVHPDRETTLRCNKCGRPMCTRCAVSTPVGYRCRECVRERQNIFYNAAKTDYVIAGVIAIILGAIGAAIVSFIGFWFYFSILISLGAGGLIADLVHRAVGRRRGRYTWLVVAGGIVIGTLMVGAVPLLLHFAWLYAAASEDIAYATPDYYPFFYSSLGIDWLIYLVVAPGAAIGRLRIGAGRIRFGR